MAIHGMTSAHTRPFDEANDALLYQDARSRIFRRCLPADPKSIICKQILGTHLSERVQHEIKILERLAGAPGVPRQSLVPAPANAIAFEDAEFIPLTQVVDVLRADFSALLQLALHLAEAISAIHRRGVLHKDINPANILIAGPPRAPVLIDFHLATTFTAAQPSFTHHNEILGTLAYLAPEQTGRTGRAVDSRADLYALGVTFYELVTGKLPFAGEDVLTLIHDHLTRVPVRPDEQNPRVPRALSDIIMRLLEKEPDRRYQSAEGLAHDVRQLCDRHARGESGSFRLGLHDFPMRLSPPTRLVGRAFEIAALQKAFRKSLQGKSDGILVSGPPGVGKTALINELRPMVTAQRGWFVSGKYDQYRHDTPSAIVQALRALGRLLLAEPESELAPQRERIRTALGPNVGLIAALLPEFAILLGQHGTTNDDPLQYQARMRQAGLALLRTIASPARPVVLVIDDLQWASSVALGSFDAILKDETLHGLLLVGSYRESEVDEVHPLTPMLARWSSCQRPPSHLRLQNLPPVQLGVLLEEMLRLQPTQAATLADAVCARTRGNPYDTVELINALRHDGALVSTGDGWKWDAATIRRFIGNGDVVDLLALRVDRLPLETRSLLEIIACLGGTVELDHLQIAGALNAMTLDAHLAPAIEDGLLLIEERGLRVDRIAVRFRHDRVQQAVYGRLDLAARHLLHLTVGRRLMASSALAPMAAEQYLTAIDAIDILDERRRVADLFRRSAAHARGIGAYAIEERYLSAAFTLLQADAGVSNDSDLVALKASWHSALYCLARYDEADKLYADIEAGCSDLEELIEPTCVQINSLVNRRRLRAAMALGVDVLNRIGITIPEAKSDTQNEPGLQALYDWVASDARTADLEERAELTDSRLLALAQLLNRTSGAAFYAGDPRLTWLLLRRHQMWIEHGPCAPLLKTFGTVPLVTMRSQDYRTGYIATAHGLTVGEARRYDYDTAWVRHCFAMLCQHWFEPLEHSVAQSRQAREALLQGGDLQYACFSYHSELIAQLESAPTLDAFAAVLAEATIFSSRTGNAISNGVHIGYQQLLEALYGDTDLDTSFAGNQPATNLHFHLVRAHAAVLFGDTALLQRHLAAALPLLPSITGFYTTALIQVFQALALAERARTTIEEERAARLLEFDACRDWLAARAENAPVNFLHLLNWIEAERAWAEGDLPKAGSLFDIALHEVRTRQRPWHHALITERAGLFHLSHHQEGIGRSLLADAQRLYQAWGATAKVRALRKTHFFLCDEPGIGAHDPDQPPGKPASAETIDMLAVLRASQTLSSETNLACLHTRIRELVGTLAGATAVQILLRRDDLQGWFLVSEKENDDAAPVSIEQAGARGLVPVSAFRYVERTREPLLVEDALRDDRFADDPYFARLDQCALLVVPILSKGMTRSLLMLENCATRGAFSADRLNAIMLIAEQLAISLNNGPP
jgi:predicted ATPase/GAF domain-containing protein